MSWELDTFVTSTCRNSFDTCVVISLAVLRFISFLTLFCTFNHTTQGIRGERRANWKLLKLWRAGIVLTCAVNSLAVLRFIGVLTPIRTFNQTAQGSRVEHRASWKPL